MFPSPSQEQLRFLELLRLTRLGGAWLFRLKHTKIGGEKMTLGLKIVGKTKQYIAIIKAERNRAQATEGLLAIQAHVPSRHRYWREFSQNDWHSLMRLHRATFPSQLILGETSVMQPDIRPAAFRQDQKSIDGLRQRDGVEEASRPNSDQVIRPRK